MGHTIGRRQQAADGTSRRDPTPPKRLSGWPAARCRFLTTTVALLLAALGAASLALVAGCASPSDARPSAGGTAAVHPGDGDTAAPVAGSPRSVPPRIVVFGDCRPNSTAPDALVNPVLPRLTTAMLARQPKLAIGVGDYIYAKWWAGGTPVVPDTRAVLDRRWRTFRSQQGRLAKRMPVALAIGNHEGVDETIEGTSTPFAGLAAWQAAFNLPSAPGAGKRYYAYDWRRQVHIVVLFSTSGGIGFAGPGKPGNSAQSRWLIADLQRNRRPWTIVVLHHPIYDPRKGDAWFDTKRAERDRLARFLRAQGVDLVVQGHDHLYRRHMQDGLPYVTQGGGGAGLTRLKPDAHDVVLYAAFGFSEIDFLNGFRSAVLRAWKVDAQGHLTRGDLMTLRNNPRH